jgi:hypothetical protein
VIMQVDRNKLKVRPGAGWPINTRLDLIFG